MKLYAADSREIDVKTYKKKIPKSAIYFISSSFYLYITKDLVNFILTKYFAIST